MNRLKLHAKHIVGVIFIVILGVISISFFVSCDSFLKISTSKTFCKLNELEIPLERSQVRKPFSHIRSESGIDGTIEEYALPVSLETLNSLRQKEIWVKGVNEDGLQLNYVNSFDSYVRDLDKSVYFTDRLYQLDPSSEISQINNQKGDIHNDLQYRSLVLDYRNNQIYIEVYNLK